MKARAARVVEAQACSPLAISYLAGVSTVQEIQQAIALLSEEQQLELMHWMYTQHEAEIEDEAALIAEAEEGERQIREGKFLTLEAIRQLTRTWITK